MYIYHIYINHMTNMITNYAGPADSKERKPLVAYVFPSSLHKFRFSKHENFRKISQNTSWQEHWSWYNRARNYRDTYSQFLRPPIDSSPGTMFFSTSATLALILSIPVEGFVSPQNKNFASVGIMQQGHGICVGGAGNIATLPRSTQTEGKQTQPKNGEARC